jgi:hypothetical protein
MKEEMTANELADKCNRIQGEIILGFLADCATMLRQQQEEIEALKNIINDGVSLVRKRASEK